MGKKPVRDEIQDYIREGWHFRIKKSKRPEIQNPSKKTAREKYRSVRPCAREQKNLGLVHLSLLA